MRLEKISLINFKNYEEISLDFSENIVCFVGENGSGKTNLLDAIHYLSLTKSAFNGQDSLSIHHGKPFFAINGQFTINGQSINIHCSLKEKQKKLFKYDNVPYDKLSEHIGKIPLVLIHPNDTDILREGSESRRKFFDSMLSQIDSIYLKNLMTYNHALKQRNSILKNFSTENNPNIDLLEPYDKILIHSGKQIWERRKTFVVRFLPYFNRYYSLVCDEKEKTSLEYQSSLNDENFQSLLKQQLQKDLILSRTTQGIHRDDFIFGINGYPIKKFGSQGQQKSFVIALKLSQFEIMREEKGYSPILLLDDVFDKLDDQRITSLITLLKLPQFQQIFITDARPERTRKIMNDLKLDNDWYEIKKGQLVSES